MVSPRVRIAPSPTGFFHVGTARTAYFNWLIARQDPDGVFVLRIEDTDEERNRDEWVEVIIESMEWLGFRADVGPYLQSEYRSAHREAAAALRRGNYAYYCDCTGEDVAARKGEDKTPGYDGFCRDRGLEPTERTALRFRAPLQGSTDIVDEIRGEVSFENRVIGDFVIAKSSGDVLYALANVVDDRRDAITHVIRGEEHLANAPKQVLLWRALDEVTGETVPLPTYAHLPLLVNEQRKKLSKRKDPVSTMAYRDEGYLVEAFVNYLALLGWSPRGDSEIVDRETVTGQFRLSDVSHSPAFFDVKKLAALNGDYVRRLSLDEFVQACLPWVDPDHATFVPTDRRPPWVPEAFDADLFRRVAPLVHERVTTLGEVPAMVRFFFESPLVLDEDAVNKVLRQDASGALVVRGVLEVLDDVEWTSSSLHALVVAVGDNVGLTLRRAQAPVRVAVTGTTVGPPLFESLEILGRAVVRERLERALSLCSAS